MNGICAEQEYETAAEKDAMMHSLIVLDFSW